jgi:hypothetical protein
MLHTANKGGPKFFEDQMASQDSGMSRRQITVPLDAELRQRLEAAAERDHRTLASYVRHIVVQSLDRQEAAA